MIPIEPLLLDLRMSPDHRELVVETFVRNNTGLRVQAPKFGNDRVALLWTCMLMINQGVKLSYSSSYGNQRELNDVREVVTEFKRSRGRS